MSLFPTRGGRAADGAALNRKFRLGFVVGICLVAVDAAIPLLLTQHIGAAHERAVALQRTALALDGLLSAYKDAETGQRGFMLTARQEYLEPYRSGRAAIESLLPRIERELEPGGARAQQLRRIADLDRLEADYQLERIEARGSRLTETLADSMRGKALMDELRRRIGLLAADLRGEHAAMAARVHRLESWNRRAIVAVTLVDLLLLSTLYQLIVRADRARTRTARELETANARMHEEIAARSDALAILERRAARLNEVIATQALLAQAQLDVGRFLQLVTQRMLAVTPATGSVVEMVEGDQMVYHTGAGPLAQYAGLRLQRAGSLSGLCIAERQVMVCHDAELDPRVDRATSRRVGVQSMVVAPLLQEGRAVGVLKIASGQACAFSEDDIQTVLLMAGMLGSALGNQLQFERIAALLAERETTLRALESELRLREQADSALARNRVRTQAIIEGSQEAFVCVDKFCVVRDWNRQAAHLFGWSREEAVGRPVAELIVPPRYRDKLRRGVERYVATGDSTAIGRRLELVGQRRDGGELPLEVTVCALEDGGETEFPCFMHDIGERKQAEAALRAQEQTLRAIADNLPVLVSFVDAEGRYRYCNGQYRAVVGSDPTGTTIRAGIGSTGYAAFEGYIDRALAGEPSTFETEIDTRDGRRVMEGHCIPQQDVLGRPAGFYIMAWDIHARKLKELQLQTRASIDPLTGAVNRAYFLEALEGACARARRSTEPLALLYLDIDHFKSVNDNLGHAAGDHVLQVFAQHLRASVREADTVCRLGGDEFCVLLENVCAEHNAIAVAEKILQFRTRAVAVEQTILTVTTSIGIAYTHGAGVEHAEALLRHADAALYKAKQWGRDQYSLYVPAAVLPAA